MNWLRSLSAAQRVWSICALLAAGAVVGAGVVFAPARDVPSTAGLTVDMPISRIAPPLGTTGKSIQTNSVRAVVPTSVPMINVLTPSVDFTSDGTGTFDVRWQDGDNDSNAVITVYYDAAAKKPSLTGNPPCPFPHMPNSDT